MKVEFQQFNDKMLDIKIMNDNMLYLVLAFAIQSEIFHIFKIVSLE